MADADRRMVLALGRAPAAVVLLRGAELRYEYINDLYGRLAPGVKVGDLFGVHSEQGAKFRALAESVLRTGNEVRLQEIAVDLQQPERRAYFDLVVHPTHGDSGAVDGVILLRPQVTAG